MCATGVARGVGREAARHYARRDGRANLDREFGTDGQRYGRRDLAGILVPAPLSSGVIPDIRQRMRCAVAGDGVDDGDVGAEFHFSLAGMLGLISSL